MTDITELAQKPTRYGTNSQGVFTNQTDGAYVSYLDFMALVEALEKAQEEAEELSKFKEVMTSAAEALKAGKPLNLESLFKGELASAMFAMMFAGEFVRSGATNYLELLYDVPEFGEMTVTLQKVEGKTPGQRIAELESRTVKLPAELYTIGELIRTQDSRITDQPMFVVFQKREIIGSDEHSPSRICWVWDGEEVSELRAKRLEALYQDGRDTRGYDRYAMQEVDEFVTACFTEHACKDFLRQNGHNLRLPYIYACGSFRNNEYQLVRNWLAGIKVEAE